MANQQYGLNPKNPYPTSKDKCGCIRIVNAHVVDYCQRHALNEIIHALKAVSVEVLDLKEEKSVQGA